MWYLIGFGMVVLVAFGFWLGQRHQRPGSTGNTSADDEHQMLSFVALLDKPQRLEPIYIATAARKAWDADLGLGEDEGEDGFVVGEADMPSLIVQYQGRIILINNFSQPYVDDPEEASESIADLRLRGLVANHTAWLSCDAMGVDSFDDEKEIGEWYKILGRLISELVDENCLAILLPQTNQVFANMDETLEMLKSDNPLQALSDDAPVPVVPIKGDDPRMIAAVDEARSRWPEFVAAFEQRRGKNFGVKAPVTVGDNTEFIWLEVTAVENNVIYGELANEPMDLGNLKLGSRVRVQLEDLNDWAYIDKQDEPQGMFTVKVLAQASKEMTEPSEDDETE